MDDQCSRYIYIYIYAVVWWITLIKSTRPILKRVGVSPKSTSPTPSMVMRVDIKAGGGDALRLQAAVFMFVYKGSYRPGETHLKPHKTTDNPVWVPMYGP